MKRSLLLSLLLVGGCSFEGPTGPARVVVEDLRVEASSATVNAFPGRPFVIVNAGASIAPAFAGQTVRLTFVMGLPQGAWIDVAGPRIKAEVAFPPCRFTVRELTGLNNGGLRIGQTISVSPCEVVVKTTGMSSSGTVETREAVLLFGGLASASLPAKVQIDRDGGVDIVDVLRTSIGTVALGERR